MSEDIVYISRGFDLEEYKKLNHKPNIAAVKFNNLIMLGLAKKIKVKALYAFDKSFNNEGIINKDSIDYYVIPAYNSVKRIIYLIKQLLNIYKEKGKEITLFCDYLCIGDCFIALLLCKLFHWKKIGIVTDLPEYLGGYIKIKDRNLKYKMYLKFVYFLLNRFDNYILLTKYMMNRIKNANNDNSIVIEGFGNTEVFKDIKVDKKKQIMYAGSLHEEFGILNLINAFINVHDKLKDFNLVIYGTGNSEEKIKEYTKKYDYIKFNGIADLETILKEEVDSTLLVNPRPVNTKEEENDYTLYSFPSKNMEYMSSGTPVLAYRLPGMPDEYLEYIYLIKEESVESIAESLKDILNKKEDELINKGLEAKEFIKNQKEYQIQINKIVNLFKLRRMHK